MKVFFGQVYIEPGVSFPFSCTFQRRLSREVTALVKPSPLFIEKYGASFNLVFNVSAKRRLRDVEIRGPSVFRKTKDVEYSVFLPFGVIMRHADAPKHALLFLLKGVCQVLDLLQIEKAKVIKRQESLIQGICSDATMLDEPWDETKNTGRVMKVFRAFFARHNSP